MTIEDERLCLICGSSNAKIVFSYNKPDQYEATVGVTHEGYFRHWVQCVDCGFYYSTYSRDPSVLDSIYSSEYRNFQSDWRESSVEDTFNLISALPNKESETKYRVKWVKTHIKQLWDSCLVKKPKNLPYKMLDVGGGNGIFSYEFQDKSWKSYVIDPDKHGKFVQDKLNIQFFNRIYSPGIAGFSFDLISLIFVLEHIRDPIEFLLGMHRDLTDDSLLYIEIPDEVAFKLKASEDEIFNSCHLWMFGPDTLLTMLNICGYQVFAINRTQTKRGYYSLMALVGKK